MASFGMAYLGRLRVLRAEPYLGEDAECRLSAPLPQTVLKEVSIGTLRRTAQLFPETHQSKFRIFFAQSVKKRIMGMPTFARFISETTVDEGFLRSRY